MDVLCFTELVRTGLWVVWAEQYALYTHFLPSHARKISNVKFGLSEKHTKFENIFLWFGCLLNKFTNHEEDFFQIFSQKVRTLPKIRSKYILG